MKTILTSYASQNFGYVQKDHRKEPRNNRLEMKIHQKRLELSSLKKLYKIANEMEKSHFSELRDTLRNEFKSLRRVEGHKKCVKDNARKKSSLLVLRRDYL